MRLPIFAGLAVLAAANEQFDDDDLNFLRMLSSNASSNSSGGAASTAAPMMNQTTTMAVTTTAMTNDTTTMAPTTTTAMDDKNATTTMAVTTTPGGGEQETDAPTTTAKGEEESMSTDLCTAKTYSLAELNEPTGGIKTDDTKPLYVECTGKDNSEESKKFYSKGTRATNTCDVKAKEYLCNGINTKEKMMEMQEGFQVAAAVQFCCGADPKFAPPRKLAGAKTGATVGMGYFTDDKCTDDNAAATSAISWKDLQMNEGSAMNTVAMGTCHDPGYGRDGLFVYFVACNTSKILMEEYFDSACGLWAGHEYLDIGCAQHYGSASNNATMYKKTMCEGGEVVVNSVVEVETKMDFSGVDFATMDTTDKTKFKTAYETTALDAVSKDLSSDVTVTADHLYTGGLADGGRRLAARRRLGSHTTASVTSTFEIKGPTAAVTTAKAAVDTKVASGALKKETLEQAVVAAIKQELPSVNVTASATVNVGTVAPDLGGSTTTTGTTSGSVTTILSVGATLAAGFALLL